MANLFQILPREESLGQQLGLGLGGGVVSGLRSLLDNNLAQQQRQNLVRGLEALPNVSSEMAQQLSLLPKELLAPYIKEAISSPQKNLPILQQLLGEELGSLVASSSPQVQSIILRQALAPQESEPQNAFEKIASMLGIVAPRAKKSIPPALQALYNIRDQEQTQSDEGFFPSQTTGISQLQQPQVQTQPSGEGNGSVEESIQDDKSQGFFDLLSKVQEATKGRREQQARLVKGSAQKALTGAGEGVVDVAKLPFTIASTLTGGRIPTPKVLDSLRDLPNSIVNAISGGEVKPGSPLEERAFEFARDTAAFLAPASFLKGVSSISSLMGKNSPWLKKAAEFLDLPLKKAASLSALGNIAKFVIKDAGGSESAQEWGKLGAQLAYPVVGSRFMGKEIADKAKEITQLIPKDSQVKGVVVPTILDMQRDLARAHSQLRGVQSSTRPVISSFKKFLEGRFHTKDLWDARQQLDKAISKHPRIVPYIKKSMENIDTLFRKNIPDIAKNKKFQNLISQYADISNAQTATSSIQNFVRKHLTLKPRNPLMTSLLYMFGLRRPDIVVPFLGFGMAVGEAERFIKLIAKNKTLRYEYGKFINAALGQKVLRAQQAAKKMDTIMEKIS